MQKVTIEIDVQDSPAIEAILKQLKHAREKHPKNFYNFSNAKKICILTEEVGEISKAHNDGDIDGFRFEVAQTAAVCIRMLSGD